MDDGVEYEEYGEDPLMDLFEASMSAEAVEEELVFDTPAVSSVDVLAGVLAGIDRQNHVKDLGASTDILKYLVSRENSVFFNSLSGKLPDAGLKNIAGMLLAVQAVSDSGLNMSVAYSSATCLEDIFGVAGRGLKQKLDFILSAGVIDWSEIPLPETVNFVHAADANTDVFGINEVSGSFLSGSFLYTLLSEDGRARADTVTSFSDIASLFFVDAYAEHIMKQDKNNYRSGILKQDLLSPEKSLASLTRKALVFAAQDQGLDVKDVPEWQIAEGYSIFSKELSDKLENMEDRFKSSDLDGDFAVRMAKINAELFERTGYIAEINRDNFSDILDLAKQHQLSLYRVVPEEEQRDLRPGILVMTKPKNGVYASGRTIEVLPAGTIGILDRDLELKLKTGGYTGFKRDEVAVLEELIFRDNSEFKPSDAVKIVRNLGPKHDHRSDEYYYAGSIDRIPLNTEGNVARIVDAAKIYVEFPQRGWYCHPNEIEHTDTSKIKTKDDVKNIYDGLLPVLEEITLAEEKSFEEEIRNTVSFIEESVSFLRSLGVSDGVIYQLFGTWNYEVRDACVKRGLIAEDNLISRLNQQAEDHKNSVMARVNKLHEKVVNETGILIEMPPIRNVGGYEFFKSALVDLIIDGFVPKYIGGRPKKGGFEEGDYVAAAEAEDNVKKGFVGRYIRECGDDNHVNFGRHLTDMHYSKNLIRVKKAHKLSLFRGKLEKGAVVRLVRHYDEAKGQYFAGANVADFPIGSEVTVERIDGDGDAVTTNQYFLPSEVEVVTNEDDFKGFKARRCRRQKKEYEELKAKFTDYVADVVSRVESEKDDVLSEFKNAVQEAVYSFSVLGYDDKRIQDIFLDKLDREMVRQAGLGIE